MDFSNVSYQTACIILACGFNLEWVCSKCLGAAGHFPRVSWHWDVRCLFLPWEIKAVWSSWRAVYKAGR